MLDQATSKAFTIYKIKATKNFAFDNIIEVEVQNQKDKSDK